MVNRRRWSTVGSAALRAAALGVTVSRLVRGGPSPGMQPETVGEPKEVSVVIPARNEALRLGPCLDALAHAGVAEIIVVDDESTDGTAELARRYGARIVTGRPPPRGWAGKAWALQQGIEAASGTIVLTLDADTRPARSLPAFVAGRLATGFDFVTVAGRFECPTPGARLLHPAMLTTLVYRFGRPDGAPSERPSLANGQCMAFAREPFLAAGGMATVAGEVVEDVALARHLAALGWKVGFVAGPEHLTVRMYETFASTWSGWGRSIALPGVEPAAAQWRDTVILGLVLVAPLARVVRRRLDPLDLVALALRLGTLFGTSGTYRPRGPAYWCSPLADPLAVARLLVSLARPARSWRGRSTPSRTAPR